MTSGERRTSGLPLARLVVDASGKGYFHIDGFELRVSEVKIHAAAGAGTSVRFKMLANVECEVHRDASSMVFKPVEGAEIEITNHEDDSRRFVSTKAGEMKYCKDCHHFGNGFGLALCRSEESRDRVGYFVSADLMRRTGGVCGPGAKLFKPQPPPVSKVSWWGRLGIRYFNQRKGECAMTIKLGDKVKDKISGYTGIATGRAQYITGCVQFAVTGLTLKADGGCSYEWLDEVRLEVVEANALQLAPPTGTPGGPSMGPRTQHSPPPGR